MTFIKLFVDYIDAIEPLGDAERGRLFTALLEYAMTGEAPQLCGNERFLFPMMRAQIDRDTQALEQLSEQRSEAGKKGVQAKQANAEFAEQKKQKQAKLSKTSKDKEEDKEEDKENIPPKSPQGECEERFAEFWKAYPKKVGKGAALFAWKKRTPGKELTQRILAAVENQKRSLQWTRDNGQYIPNPATWLNQQRWEDELEGEKQAQARDSKSYDIEELERLSYFDLPDEVGGVT